MVKKMVLIDVTDDLIHIHGHAGAAPHGQSVPCEAVTALCNSIAASMESITEQPEKILNFESGKFKMNRKDLSAESELLVRSFLLALDLVSEAYPEYIQVTKAVMS